MGKPSFWGLRNAFHGRSHRFYPWLPYSAQQQETWAVFIPPPIPHPVACVSFVLSVSDSLFLHYVVRTLTAAPKSRLRVRIKGKSVQHN